MHKSLRFVRAIIIFTMSIFAVASIMLLIIALGSTERWDDYPAHETISQFSAGAETETKSGGGRQASIEVTKTSREAKPLSTWPPEEADRQTPQE